MSEAKQYETPIEDIGNEAETVISWASAAAGLAAPRAPRAPPALLQRFARLFHRKEIEKPNKRSLKTTVIEVYRFGPSPDDYDSEPLDYDPEDRNSFVAIVMGIVILMLITSIATVAVVSRVKSIQNLILRFKFVIMGVSIVSIMFAYYGLACYAYARRIPCNFLLLLIGLTGFNGMLALAACIYPPLIILIAAGVTLVLVLICFGLAFTSFDFTSIYIYLIIFIVALTLASVFFVIAKIYLGLSLTWIRIIICVAAIVIYAMMLIAEVQMVLGGRSYEYGVDDYAFAAFTIYTSIIFIFMRILELLSYLSDEGFLGDAGDMFDND